MNTIKVNKSKLLEELEKNKKMHEQEFKELWGDFQLAIVEELSGFLKLASDKKLNNVPKLETVKPVSYVKEYDNAIQMLNFSIDSEIEITQEEFSQYVQNEWHWKRTFDNMKLSYGKS